MKHLLDVLHGLFQRILLPAISDDKFNGGILHPSQPHFVTHKTSDLGSPLNKGFHQVTADKSCCACNQNLQSVLPR
jgi:hypothetical protein